MIKEIQLDTLERAKTLSRVLSRAEKIESILKLSGGKKNLHVAYPSDVNANGRADVVLNEQFVRGMKRVGFSLYQDLRSQGEEDLATRIVDQHRTETVVWSRSDGATTKEE